MNPDEWALPFPEVSNWKNDIVSKKEFIRRWFTQQNVVITGQNQYHYDMGMARNTSVMLGSIEALSDSIRKELSRTSFDTTLLNYLRQQLQGLTIDAGRGAEFKVLHVVVYNGTEIRITGKLEYMYPVTKEMRTDTGAIITVTRDGRAWTKSSTWSPGKQQQIEMPPSVKQRVAEQAKFMVDRALPDDHYWSVLLRESETEDHEQAVQQAIRTAEGALTNALAALTKHNGS